MSKADRLRRKKRKAELKGLPELSAVPRRIKRGKARMAEISRESEAAVMQVVVAARIARGAKDAAAARDPLQGDDMGRCILALTGAEERRGISDTWAALSAAWANYCTRILGRSLGPQSSSIQFVTEPMEADQSLRIDPRTPDERDAAAKRAWVHWQGRLDDLPTPQHRWAIRGALQGFMGDETLWRDRRPTSSGRTAVAALRILTG